jgi:general secretion pathway protein F/type IV pilus assembly protein PilC
MPTFTYKAMSSTGQAVTGVLTAENEHAALRMIDDRAMFPLEVRAGSGVKKGILGGGHRKVKASRVGGFYGQLGDLLNAGVPMLRSMDVLARMDADPTLTEIVREIREDVASGETLADAMAKHPAVFKDLHVSMVRAGEAGGFLEDVLNRLGDFAEKQDELRKKLIGSMIYPIILICAAIMMITGLLVFVIPKLRPMLEKQELNILTRSVFMAGDLVRDYGLYLVGAIVVGVVSIWTYAKSEKGRYVVDQAKLKVPMLGNIICMVAVCRFCRILGTLLHSGVPILQALKVSKESAGNLVLAGHIEAAADSVQKGETLSTPLGASGVFPPDIVDMIAVAEESNSLEKVLVQVAETNEARTARTIDLAVRMLEPLLLVFMAGAVLLIALAILVPILNISSGGLS